jgi:Flp pilus assembly protein TadD
VGNLTAAESAFGKSECLLTDTDSHAPVRVNRGLLAMAQGDYALARDEFGAALELEPSSSIAANNRAVCLLHLCQIGEAIGALEDFLRADPVKHLDSTLVGNLAAMYELHSDASSAAARRVLDQLVAMVGADDFELAQLRPAGP